MTQNNKKLRIGDLFAGVGGFSLGFMREGFDLAWAVEWDKTCQKVLRKQHPHTKIFGDITKVSDADLDDVDIIIGGSPCQDLSVAGKRKGLEGERSGLFHEFIRLVRAKRPRWVVWENVPGALSSNGGKDFAVVLGEMADSGYPDVAYRVLNARYFGVAQRRRRVFIVASREAVGGPSESRAARVLGLLEPIRPQQEGLRRHIEACRAQGQAPAPTAERGAKAAGGKGRVIFAEDYADPLTVKEQSTWTHEGSNNFRTHNLSVVEEALSEGGKGGEVGQSKFFADEGGGKWWDGGSVAANLTTRCHDQFMPDKGNFAAVIDHGPVGMNASAGPISPSDGSDNKVPSQGFRYVNQQTGIVPTDEVAPLRSCMGRAGVHEYNHPVIAQGDGKSEDTLAIRLGQTGANGIGVSSEAYTLDGSSPQAIMQPGEVQALAFQPRFFTRDQRTGNADSCSSEVISPLMAGAVGDSANHVAIAGQQLPQAYSIREDAINNNFSATPLEVANAIQALQAAPSSHHAQTYITDVHASAGDQTTVGALCARDWKGVGNQYVSEGKCIVQNDPKVGAAAYDGMNQKLEPEVHHALRTGKDSGDCIISGPEVFRKSARAQSSTDSESWIPADFSNTLNGFDIGERDTHAVVREEKTEEPAAFTCSEQSNSFAWERPEYPTITAKTPNDTSNLQQGVRCGMVVRRLTPVECCILMGWPHDWNEFGMDEAGHIVAISDSQRYKECGNGVVSNCSQWIAAGIRAIEEGVT